MIKKHKRISRFGFLFLVTFVAAVSAGNCTELWAESSHAPTADCRDFQQLIAKTYDFTPRKLTEAQQTEKSAEMDKVWNQVKANRDALIPCLKESLTSPSANSFFLFDGSTLLLEVDPSREAKELLIRSYTKTDLEQIVLSNWIAPILRLGLEGLDTSAAGEAWLNDQDAKYYLPQHGNLAVDRSIGALAIFGSMDEQFATPALARLARSPDEKLREIAASILLNQGTSDSVRQAKLLDPKQFSSKVRDQLNRIDAKPASISPRNGKPKVTREEFVEAFRKMANGDATDFTDLTVKVSDGERDAIVVLTKDDLPLLRKSRRFMASTGTPHIPEWYKSFTDIILALAWKPATPGK